MVETATVIPTVTPEYAKRLAFRNNAPHQKVWDCLDLVFDPELPGLTIWDLGILQDVQFDNGIYTIVITLTYSGCPAVDMITQDIKKELAAEDIHQVKVKLSLTPIWTTEMMSPAGKQHLRSINIAPPEENNVVCCPQCNSNNTKLISQFGSTACKAFYQCNECQESFDYFKNF